MKKFEVRSLLALLLAMMMVFTLVACGNADDTLPPETDETEPVVTEPTETEPAETEPAETEPAETDPTETKPAETEPPKHDPVETDPPATEPAETEPAKTEPADTECAHKFGKGDVVIPTCQAEGYTEYTCTVCGETKTDSIKPKVGHLYVTTTITSASCTADGEIADVCSYCGDTKNSTVVPAYGHEGTTKIVDSTTFTHHKIELQSCVSCGAVYGAKGAQGEEHTFALVGTVADQTTEMGYTAYGYEVHECTTCGYSLKVSANHADGHYYEVDTNGKYACKCGSIYTGESLKDVLNGNLEAGPVIFAD